MTFAPLLSSDGADVKEPRFGSVGQESVVFAPHDKSDIRGTEDPRVAYDNSTGTYYMFYTCYGEANPSVTLCLATSQTPLDQAAWTRHGPVGFGMGSKSGALLIRDKPPHYLYWGAGVIHVTSSEDLLQ
jgi:predicted GH43/DUF377 family glycosyl hydrolase